MSSSAAIAVAHQPSHALSLESNQNYLQDARRSGEGALQRCAAAYRSNPHVQQPEQEI